jgi:hypothetical protein
MGAVPPLLKPSEAVSVTALPWFTDVAVLLKASDVGVTGAAELLLLQPERPASVAAARKAVQKT